MRARAAAGRVRYLLRWRAVLGLGHMTLLQLLGLLLVLALHAGRGRGVLGLRGHFRVVLLLLFRQCLALLVMPGLHRGAIAGLGPLLFGGVRSGHRHGC